MCGYVHVYMYKHVCLHVCAHAHMHEYTHMQVFVLCCAHVFGWAMCGYMHMCMVFCVHVEYTHAGMGVYTCEGVCTCVQQVYGVCVHMWG
jgi:hypothetical protein